MPKKPSQKIAETSGKRSFSEGSKNLKSSNPPSLPIKPRLDFATSRIEHQCQKLDEATDRLNERDRIIFAEVVNACKENDELRVDIYASELVEVREFKKLVINARLALDQIALRLRTVSELDDVVSTLGPAVGVLKSVRTGLVSVFPESEHELGEIGNMLNGVMAEAGQNSRATPNFKQVDIDALKTLEESGATLENEAEDKNPTSDDLNKRKKVPTS